MEFSYKIIKVKLGLGDTCIQVSNRVELDVIVIDYCGCLVVIANLPGSGCTCITLPCFDHGKSIHE
jgi:hypothetical protein